MKCCIAFYKLWLPKNVLAIFNVIIFILSLWFSAFLYEDDFFMEICFNSEVLANPFDGNNWYLIQSKPQTSKSYFANKITQSALHGATFDILITYPAKLILKQINILLKCDLTSSKI